MRFFPMLCLLLLPLQLLADAYYAVFKDAGKVSESGADVVLYYDNGDIWGYLRDYSNMRDNIYANLYGKGSPDDRS